MPINEIMEKVWLWCETFGAKYPRDYVRRTNVSTNTFEQGGAFFACIQPDEAPTGAYHDFSFVVFPDQDKGPWLVCLGVGSLGFRNDYELAALPGIRRRYLKLIGENGYIKTDFTDINTNLDDVFVAKVPDLKKTIDLYTKVLPACEIITDIHSLDGEAKLKAFLALYAEIRNWPTNNQHRKAVRNAIQAGSVTKKEVKDNQQVLQLLLQRKYVVLQGAPGTGKTRLAKELVKTLEAKSYFIQFHAETSYADFIWGIRPKLSNGTIGYDSIDGPFVQAVTFAKEHPKQNVLLIIDEINRANLSNVLGPVFYLFEYQMDNRNLVEMKIANELTISRLPDNFYVIATMNTADRSLAVVDFALRRRFAWYTMLPSNIELNNGLIFFKEYFDSIQDIFEKYAKDEELSLMPGQGYFIAKNEDEMLSRLRYELLPLIKEYLMEGLMPVSRDAFVHFFHDKLHEDMYR